MKLGQKIYPNYILDEFENGLGWLKKIATWTRGIFHDMALLQHCLHSRGHIYCPIIMKLGQKICPNDILDELTNSSGLFKNMGTRGR